MHVQLLSLEHFVFSGQRLHEDLLAKGKERSVVQDPGGAALQQ